MDWNPLIRFLSNLQDSFDLRKSLTRQIVACVVEASLNEPEIALDCGDTMLEHFENGKECVGWAFLSYENCTILPADFENGFWKKEL